MQFSNGLSNPAGLWLGHLLFDSMFGVFCATILTIVFAAKSTFFQGLGYLVSNSHSGDRRSIDFVFFTSSSGSS